MSDRAEPAATPTPRSRAALALAPATLLGLVLVLFSDAIFGGRVFFERDVQLVWYGQVESFVRCVAAGSWPLWDLYVAFGHPMLANPNAQVLYPPTWLNFVMRPATYYTAYTVAHLFLAGMGLFFFARRLGLSLGAALCGSAIWLLSGPLLSLVNVWHHFAAACWIPWIFLAAERALAAASPLHVVAVAGALALQALAGSPDTSLMTGLALVAYTLFHRRTGLRPLVSQRVLPMACAALLAVGLAAGQLVPSLDAAAGSARAELAAGDRTGWAVHPVGLAQALTPVVWTEVPISDSVRARLFDGGHPFLRALYLGIASLGLVGAAFAAPAFGRRGFWTALAVVATVYATGTHGFLYDVMTTLLPPLRSLRYPSKAFVLTAFAWAMIAAIGFDAVGGAAGGTRWKLRAGLPLAAATVAAAVLAVVAHGAAPSTAGWLAPEAVGAQSAAALLDPAARKLAVAAVLGLLSLVTLVSSRVPAGLRAGLLAGLAALDLMAAHRGINRTAPADFYRYRPPALDAITQQDGSRLYVHRYAMGAGARLPGGQGTNPYRLDAYPATMDVESGRALAVRLYMLPPSTASWGLYTSYDPDLLGLYPQPLQRLVGAMEAAAGSPGFIQLLQMGAVRHVSALYAQGLEALEPAGEFKSLLVEPIRLFRVPAARPRSYVVGEARVVNDDAAALSLLTSPGFDPARTVVLAAGGATPVAEATGALAGDSRILELAPDRVRLEVIASAPGHVVMVDTYEPGWKATVDGRPAPVLRANVAFRAVAVPAGRHSVEMRYHPRAVQLGMLISALSLLICAGVWIASRGRPRPA